jgi:hypothetical protein
LDSDEEPPQPTVLVAFTKNWYETPFVWRQNPIRTAGKPLQPSTHQARQEDAERVGDGSEASGHRRDSVIDNSVAVVRRGNERDGGRLVAKHGVHRSGHTGLGGCARYSQMAEANEENRISVPGVTALEGADCGPVPISEVVFTTKVYETPLV